MSARSLTNQELSKAKELLLILSRFNDAESIVDSNNGKAVLAIEQAIMSQLLLAYRVFLYEVGEEQGLSGYDFANAAELNQALQSKLGGETLLPDLLEAEQHHWLKQVLSCASPSATLSIASSRVSQSDRQANSNFIKLQQVDEFQDLPKGVISRPGLVNDIKDRYESLRELVFRVRSLNQQW